MPISKPSNNSMVGRLRRVAVCSPQKAQWNSPVIAGSWRELGFDHEPNATTAQAQHDEICCHLQAAGAEIISLPGSPGLSLDAVYAHDPSLMTAFGAIILHPGKPNRIPEAQAHRSLFTALGLPILGEVKPPGKAEAGDMVWLGQQTLLIGRGFRTNAAGIAQIRDLLKGVDVISAPLPYGPGPAACLHLMSLISLLDEHTAIVDLPWLAVETVELLQSRGYNLVEIDYSERETLACNVLALGERRLVAIAENEKTNQKLRNAGFEVATFQGSELCINGSGGPTCLTRPLVRD